ncbi:Adenosyl cobinamide kinase-adenosyl cobinamide phosphate guanylyltransferase protein [Salinisphaera shabanensis E1L3A]|jgi:adenosylcobinamide kinase/adenosylcobinamide-phosphate guanylyltransferase|uniref:Bifunctional adenosylcobalamin biosynthesis protein n=1 Tax=Salinisphaera shabanensis E1L3A TaxID=1033802 RepID=U2E4M3_9GAMM|nr:bifunctional adenosylcobinamide kinase/adenosylcobinamide-phosphate guanylyltransferase [Salinisphaera shabanensis]ERJ18796.1 Adenosyl cobinamide kinase-adenosyl cobinamide phosphate guanylyltransferase protein [Salinisphaera shabanensis E1L3A]
MKELVLGGTRSGKSGYAEAQALSLSVSRWVYVATAQAGDDEMAARIQHHREQRDARWQTVEAPQALGDCLRRLDAPDTCILVDCLTLWLSNCLGDEAQRWAEEREALLAAVDDSRATLIFVSNEVGSGIVPLGALSRRFADEAGRLHQALAERCDRVMLVVAGLPLTLKDKKS